MKSNGPVKLLRFGWGGSCATIIALLLSSTAPVAFSCAEAKPKSQPAAKVSSKPKSEKVASQELTFEPLTLGSVDRVVASIDGEPVTISDVHDYVRSTGSDAALKFDPTAPEFRKIVLEYLSHELLVREAKAAGVAVTEPEIDAYIAEIKNQNHFDDTQLSELLKSRGLNTESYRKQVASDILRTRIVGNRLRAKINVSDEDITRFAGTRPDSAPAAGSLRLEQVYIPKGNDPEKAKEEIEKVADADSESEFRELGGANFTDLGYLDPSDLRTELQTAVGGVDVDELSEVVENEDGYLLVYVVEKSDGSSEPKAPVISEAEKEVIRQQIFQERMKDELERYLTVELPKKYNVEFN